MNNLIYALTGVKPDGLMQASFDYKEPSKVQGDLKFIRDIFHLTDYDYAVRMARVMQADHYLAMKLPTIDTDIQLRSALPDKTIKFEFSVKDTIEAYMHVPELFNLLQAANIVDLFYLADSAEEQYAIVGYAITKLVNYV